MNQQASYSIDDRDFRRIARSIAWLDAHWREQPRLAALAAHAGLSEFHFNRLFRRWAGVTPRQYLAHLTSQAARKALANEPSVLDAALSVGLSGAGRLHDLMVTIEAMSPGELRSGGAGLVLTHGFAASPFGTMFVAESTRGIARLEFAECSARAALERALREEWPAARLVADDAAATRLAARLWGSAAAQGRSAASQARPVAATVAPRAPVRLAVRGTNFELKVWRALLALEEPTTTYGEIARAIGQPDSARAVGNAVGANPVAVLIPCHRVLRKDGSLGGYRWGADRKRALLAWESMVSA